ncbi:hypothetical protein LZ30DRAFT_611176 [Colletotrichum cereale]|nr:hypothetical protein LZ30DRAFT_611176 [Colletotrichum cereale]
MQFADFVIAVLSTLAAAQTTAQLPFTNELCDTLRSGCAASNDNIQRCLLINAGSLCTFNCVGNTTCPTQCQQQGHKFGFCTNGDIPCICSDVQGDRDV